MALSGKAVSGPPVGVSDPHRLATHVAGRRRCRDRRRSTRHGGCRGQPVTVLCGGPSGSSLQMSRDMGDGPCGGGVRYERHLGGHMKAAALVLTFLASATVSAQEPAPGYAPVNG